MKSLTITENDNNKNRGASATKVTSIQGKNLTITKMETIESDADSVSNMSSVSNSTGSFVSDSSSTLVARSNPRFAEPSSTQTLNVSESFGKEMVDNVRSRQVLYLCKKLSFMN